jgi:hypothetical protein
VLEVLAMVFDRFVRALPVLATVIALAGCVTVGPVASPTPPPTAAPTASPAPTAPPTATPTVPPTATPTPTPTPKPTPTPTPKPTAEPTPTPTTEPTTPPDDTTLDPNRTARYDLEDPVNSGFLPDPMTVAVVSGGPIDVSYLGAPCTGYAEPNPDVQVHYVSGSGTLLRFYFVPDNAGEDATLIVNDTSSHWVCNDDSFGGSNPSIDFSPPAGGYYDIWIGSYQSGAFISGTLNITELDYNHP